MKYTVEFRKTEYMSTEVEAKSVDDAIELAWEEYRLGNVRDEWEQNETEIVDLYDENNNGVWSL